MCVGGRIPAISGAVCVGLVTIYIASLCFRGRLAFFWRAWRNNLASANSEQGWVWQLASTTKLLLS